MAEAAPMTEATAHDGGGADVQVEDGFTRIAHPVLEALALASFNVSQSKIVLHVIRESWGWCRKDAELTYTAMVKATGLARSSVSDAIRSLTSEGVLIQVREPTFREAGVYRLQKDPRKWGRFACTPPSLAESSASRTVRPTEQDRPAVPNSTGQPNSRVPASRTVRLGNANNDNTLHDPKERERKERKSTTHHHQGAGAGGFDRLQEYLGTHGDAVDRFAASAEHSPTWAAAVVGLYGPAGTDDGAWNRSPPAERPALLARALDRYAGEGQTYNGRYFRRFLEAVVNEQRNDRPGGGGNHGNGKRDARGAGAEAKREARRSEPGRRSQFVYG